MEKTDRFLSFGKKLGCTFFFQELWVEIAFAKSLDFFRFDTRSTRLSRRQTDKSALISAVWDKFIKNCIVCCKPRELQ